MEELFDGSPTHRPISGTEYAGWKRFYARCPFGPVRGDLQAAMVCQTIYASRGVKRLPKLESFVIRTVSRDEADAERRKKFSPEGIGRLAAVLGCKVIPPPGSK